MRTYPRICIMSSKMSSIILNCEKSTTRWPPAYSCVSSRSSTASLPLACTRSSPVLPSKSGSADGNRYGWLQHLRSWMNSACGMRNDLAHSERLQEKAFFAQRNVHARTRWTVSDE